MRTDGVGHLLGDGVFAFVGFMVGFIAILLFIEPSVRNNTEGTAKDGSLVAKREAGLPSTQSVMDQRIRKGLAALEGARAKQASSIDGLPRTLTPYQKLRYRYMSVTMFHQRLIAKISERTRHCRGYNDSPLYLRIGFHAQMSEEGVHLNDPRVSDLKRGGVADPVRDCLIKAYGTELHFQSEPGFALPDYVGDIETDLRWGTVPRAERKDKDMNDGE